MKSRSNRNRKCRDMGDIMGAMSDEIRARIDDSCLSCSEVAGRIGVNSHRLSLMRSRKTIARCRLSSVIDTLLALGVEVRLCPVVRGLKQEYGTEIRRMELPDSAAIEVRLGSFLGACLADEIEARETTKSALAVRMSKPASSISHACNPTGSRRLTSGSILEALRVLGCKVDLGPEFRKLPESQSAVA